MPSYREAALCIMGFHQEHILPHLIDCAMRNRELVPYRGRVAAAAKGRVLSASGY